MSWRTGCEERADPCACGERLAAPWAGSRRSRRRTARSRPRCRGRRRRGTAPGRSGRPAAPDEGEWLSSARSRSPRRSCARYRVGRPADGRWPGQSPSSPDRSRKADRRVRRHRGSAPIRHRAGRFPRRRWRSGPARRRGRQGVRQPRAEILGGRRARGVRRHAEERRLQPVIAMTCVGKGGPDGWLVSLRADAVRRGR